MALFHLESNTLYISVNQCNQWEYNIPRTSTDEHGNTVSAVISYFCAAKEQTLGRQIQPYFLFAYQSTPSQQAHL